MTYIIEYGYGDYLGEDTVITPHDTFERDCFCSYSCYYDFIEEKLELIPSTVHNTGPKAIGRKNNSVTAPYNFIDAGEYPCILSEYDYDVYCANCETKIHDGDEDE